MNIKLTIPNVVFAFIIFLMALKFTFSYLTVELDWWLRFLTPNHEKFNPLHLPKNLSEYLEFLIIPTILFYLFISFGKLGPLKIPLFLTGVLLLLNCVTSYLNNINILESIRYTLKISAPIYFFCVLVVHSKRTGHNFNTLFIGSILYIVFLCIIALLFFDVSFNRGAYRYPVFFSGLHTHNYILAVTFIAISLFLRKHTYILTLYFLATFAFLALGYGVRTPMVFYLIYISMVFYLKENLFKNIYARILAYLPFLGLFLFSALKNFDFNSFSSGRLSMYAKKFDILRYYKLEEYLFGRGWGSDLVKTKEWWYAEKGSHNDYLTFLVENGAIYLFMFLVLIGSLLFLTKKNHLIYMTLIFGYLFTSIISNGLAVRALAGYWFFAVLAFIYIEYKNQKLSFA
ncbi:hypothetical protein KXJ69_03960 [Aureisphaera sp. CAU 1614]|uniref:O-antigen ligase domain-containing protein n=1 Tax=Halomarinibacterium sedimenti TaxID=2857106 RepID=A0A9X1JZG2_9FLAO|nr:hypothetical protein [Halomarinibacterium sedimenti]MBW2937246.1 hypothetical protein [Halomarinibacterium sedimenti]